MKLPVMFIGRWQPCHAGHIALWKAGAWDLGHPALIYVRDIPPNKHNPFTTKQTVELIEAALADIAASAPPVDIRVIQNTTIMTGPDVAAVRYGRGVGYLVEEIELSEDIQGISATEVRAKIENGLPGWRDFVTPGVAELLLTMEWGFEPPYKHEADL